MMHGHRRTIGWVAGLSMVLALALPGVARAEKLGFVDMQRAMEGTTEGKALMTKLRGEVEKKQKEFEQKREELKKMSEDLDKQATVLKPDVLEKKRQELGQKVQQFQETGMRMEREFQEKQQKAVQPIQEKLVRIIAQIAQRDHFTAVLRGEVVLWPPQSEMDITNEVIRKANEASPK